MGLVLGPGALLRASCSDSPQLSERRGLRARSEFCGAGARTSLTALVGAQRRPPHRGDPPDTTCRDATCLAGRERGLQANVRNIRAAVSARKNANIARSKRSSTSFVNLAPQEIAMALAGKISPTAARLT